MYNILVRLCVLIPKHNYGGVKMAVIELKSVSKNSKNRPDIVDASFVVKQGDIFGLVGSNGSGKSTIIDILLNYIPTYSGSVSIFDKNPKKEGTKIKEKCGYVPADPDFLLSMRGCDILDITAKVRKCKDFDKIIKLCNYFGIQQDKYIGAMTISECKILSLINAVFFEPDLLILDEPFLGLDDSKLDKVKDLLQYLNNKKNMTIFMTTDNIDDVNKLCTRFAIIHRGSVLEVQEKEQLLTSDVRRISAKVCGNISPIFKLLNIKNVTMEGEYVNFLFKGNINELFTALNYYKVEDIQISLPNLSDVICQIYDEKEKNNENKIDDEKVNV